MTKNLALQFNNLLTTSSNFRDIDMVSFTIDIVIKGGFHTSILKFIPLI